MNKLMTIGLASLATVTGLAAAFVGGGERGDVDAMLLRRLAATEAALDRSEAARLRAEKEVARLSAGAEAGEDEVTFADDAELEDQTESDQFDNTIADPPPPPTVFVPADQAVGQTFVG